MIETAKLQTANLVVMVNGLNELLQHCQFKSWYSSTINITSKYCKAKQMNPQKLLTPSVDSCLNR